MGAPKAHAVSARFERAAFHERSIRESSKGLGIGREMAEIQPNPPLIWHFRGNRVICAGD